MKKSIFVLIIGLIVLPFTVFAATSGVKTLDAVSTNTGIRFNGTTDDGILAASCTLYDKDNNDIDFVSVPVSSNAFEGTFTIANGKYTVKCANYDGGTIVEKEVTVTGSVTAPATGDNITIYLILLGLSISGIVLTKKKING